MDSPIKFLVLDILKPHSPNIIEYGKRIGGMRDISGVNVTVVEIDEKTETIRLTVRGSRINYEDLLDTVRDLGGTVHSIDEVSAGKKLIRDSNPPRGQNR
jgi:hypothetical protein